MDSPNSSPQPWPVTADPPFTDGVLRATPEDFVVEERLPFTLTGQGEHLWLQTRKRGMNTDRAAQALARSAGVPRRNVGYAGMKDKHAVAIQWFSIYLPGRPDPDLAALPPELEVLTATRHARKLQTGALAGNCFDIVLRECAGDAVALARRIASIRTQGVPNYFGEQRFGRNGENLRHAQAMFAGTERPRDRHLHGIYLSAARAFLFNEVLAARIRAGNWQALLAGEACVLDGSRSFFVAAQPDDTLQQRLVGLDIHPSGPLWGTGELPATGTARRFEEEILARHAELAHGLAAAGLRQERRALRLIPKDLVVEETEAGAWRFRFCLSPGTFATAVLRELVAYRVAGGEPQAADIP
jgi:tRNA pseudouridine13 synthase